MAGTIKPYKNQKNEWVLRYDSTDPTTGKRRQHRRRFTGSKREANKHLQRILGEVDSGIYSDLGNITLKQYLEKWIDAYCTPTNLQLKTRKSYISTINNHIIPNLGRHKLNNLKVAHIADYYALMSKPLAEGGAGLSPTTVLYHHRILHHALRHAVNQDYLRQNPVDKVQPPRKNRPEVKVLSVEQARYIITHYTDTKIYLPVFLALMTGMREAEIAALRWPNVDFKNKTLSVTNALQRQENGLVLKEPKTKKSRRIIPVPEQVIAVLTKEKYKQNTYKNNLGEGYDSRNFVCAWEDGKPYDPEWIGKQWTKLVASDDNIPNGVRFHDLRHTHATILLSQNINLKVIQERLGHESIVTTGDIYSHVTPGIQKAAADVLGNLFSSKNFT